MLLLGISSPQDVSNAAKGFGELNGSSVWALFAIIFLVYIFWDARNKKNLSEKEFSIRIEEAKAITLMSSAFENMTDKICDQMRELRNKIRCLGDKDV